MEFLSDIFQPLSSVVLLGVLGFVLKIWIDKRIHWSIAHEYELERKAIEHQREIRMRSALVAELLAVWMDQVPITDRSKLNQLTFEAFLWLPEPIARDLSAMLSHKPGADNVRDILIKVRKQLLGADDGLKPFEVIVFPRPLTVEITKPEQVQEKKL